MMITRTSIDQHVPALNLVLLRTAQIAGDQLFELRADPDAVQIAVLNNLPSVYSRDRAESGLILASLTSDPRSCSCCAC